jgi:8-oxo-dGTP diphosphatase
MGTRFEISAGGVVLRRDPEGQLEVALIATHESERWALPKGLVKKDEPLADAALREVREETGLEAEIVTPLPPIDYWFWWGQPGKKVRHHKQVHFFVMAWRGGDTARHDAEVDEVRWFPLHEAILLASYQSERDILEQARKQGNLIS